MAESTTQPRETVKAAEAFAAYVAMGEGRTLEKLAEVRVSRGLSGNIPSALTLLKKWSAMHHWQDRLRQAANARAESLLEEAAALDAETFLQSSRLLNERMHYATREHADAIVKMRESVRKPTPKGGTSVSVSVNLEIRQMVDKIAEEDGLTDQERQELLDAVQRHLAGAP